MELMQTPADIFEDALLYIRVIFIGIFATVFYNILAGILRALGDSISPLIVILVSSAVNVGSTCCSSWCFAGALRARRGPLCSRRRFPA